MWNQWKIFEKMTEDLNHVLFWGPKWPRNRASGPDIQHPSKKYLKSTCKPRLMWHQWKIFEKMTEDWNFVLFWGPKWPKNWTSEAHIPHTSKSSCNEHVKQYWCETSENFLRKWPKSRILTYFGIQNGPKIGPFGPILYISLKVAPMSIYKARLMWI